jgi:hypothetical protein
MKGLTCSLGRISLSCNAMARNSEEQCLLGVNDIAGLAKQAESVRR